MMEYTGGVLGAEIALVGMWWVHICTVYAKNRQNSGADHSPWPQPPISAQNSSVV